MTPLQKQQNPISKRKYILKASICPSSQRVFWLLKHQLAGGQNPSPPNKTLGEICQNFSAPRCNSLTPILVTATSQWTEQLAGNAAADRLLGKGHRTRTGCFLYFRRSKLSVFFGPPLFAEQFPGNLTTAEATLFIHIYIPCHATRATLLMCERWNVSME